MDKLLLMVEDSFQLSGRGFLIIPFVSPELLGTSDNGYKTNVRLVRPDGTSEVAKAAFYWEHLNPGGFRYACFLKNGHKEKVPTGTEVWLFDND